jgi:hypothetical protein
MQHINAIIYGSPDRTQLELLKSETYLDKCFPDLTPVTFSPNDSKNTIEELQLLAEATNALATDEQSQKTFFSYDRFLPEVMVNYLVKRGEEATKAQSLVDSIFRDANPLIAKLKFYFQRARPYQVSFAHGIKMFPFSSLSNSPSYPSAEAVQAKLFAEIVGNQYPKLFKNVHGFAGHVCQGRIYMGLNYPSDIDFAQITVSKIVDYRDFKLKYQL